MPGFPAAIMGAVGGEPGDRMLLGVCTVWVLGVMLLEDLGAVRGKDAVGERGADLFWG